MWRHIASNALSLLIVLLIAAAGVLGWAQARYHADGPLADALCVRVEPGSTMRQLSRDLAERGAIERPALFRVGAEYADKAQELKAGSFRVPAGASMAEILEIVTTGGQSTCGTEILYRIGVTSADVRVRELDPETNRYEPIAEFEPGAESAPDAYAEARDRSDTRYRVSVAEGATSWQVANALEAVDILSGELPEVPAEGSLAPESYEIAAGDERSSLIARMQDLQAARLDEAWANRAENLPIASKEEALILASIIEKETGVPEERDRVASVFVNRLREGMRLQTDPTVIYGITEGQGSLGRGLRQSELRAETPYNTYVIDGLPPTPIANPGLASLVAAVDPAETDFRYFVADGTGGHVFAETLEEHNANVARWREIEAQQAGQ